MRDQEKFGVLDKKQCQEQPHSWHSISSNLEKHSYERGQSVPGLFSLPSRYDLGSPSSSDQWSLWQNSGSTPLTSCVTFSKLLKATEFSFSLQWGKDLGRKRTWCQAIVWCYFQYLLLSSSFLDTKKKRRDFSFIQPEMDLSGVMSHSSSSGLVTVTWLMLLWSYRGGILHSVFEIHKWLRVHRLSVLHTHTHTPQTQAELPIRILGDEEAWNIFLKSSTLGSECYTYSNSYTLWGYTTILLKNRYFLFKFNFIFISLYLYYIMYTHLVWRWYMYRTHL